MLLCTDARAQEGRHLLLVLHPPSDQRLDDLTAGLTGALRNTTITLYTVKTHHRPDGARHAEGELSEAKDAYEFLRFDESLRHLNDAIAALKNNAVPSNAVDTLKEAYLYRAMNFLALDKAQDAEQAVADYSCIAGGSGPDPVLYPPPLIDIIEKERSQGDRDLLTVTITTSPPGADVFIDGRKVGTSPAVIPLHPCRHFLRLTGPAYSTKSASLMVSNTKTAFAFDMEPDPLSIESGTLSRGQILGILMAYKTDEIVILSLHKGRITIAAARASPFTVSTSTILYKDRRQALEDITVFLRPGKHTTAPDTILAVSPDKRAEHPERTGNRWYKNKWLWTAGAAIVAGGLIWGLSSGLSRSSTPSSSTGSISITW